MIKNIPNKFTQEGLRSYLERTHLGAFDFLYLPIDFETLCNFGYAFINMKDLAQVKSFHKKFNGSRWNCQFNTKKVCEITYARI